MTDTTECPTCKGSGRLPEVSPCPFCGEHPTVLSEDERADDKYRPWIECCSMYCPNPSVCDNSRGAAIERWNQRSTT